MRNRVGLLLCDDLVFASKITATARALGLPMSVGKTPQLVLEQAGREFPSCVVIDLNLEGLDLARFLEKLRECCCEMPRVVGYGSHVLADVLREARRLGCDPVMPRSTFVQILESDLTGWLEP